MSNNKQSNIEWLRSLYENGPAYEECILDEEWEQAKAMHKEEHYNTFYESRLTHPMIGFKHGTFEEYYEQTYGGNK